MTIKLLAVDDSSTMRKVLGITFAGDGFQITTCKSGAEALEAVRSASPAVALIDASLAGESGYDLCQELRKVVPGLPVLILSSKQRGYDEGAGKAAGAMGNFDKPFDSQKLIDKVQSLLAPGGAVAVAAPAPAAEPRAAQSTLVGGMAPPAAAGPVAVARVTLSTAQVPAASVPAARSAPQPAPRPLAPAPFASDPAPARPAPSPAQAPAVAAKTNAGSEFSSKLNGLGLSADQVAGVLALSKEVVEQVVWEIVPALAETMIREEIRRLTADSK